MICIALLGHGVVGSGVMEILNEKKESFLQKMGQEVYCKYILDLRDFPDAPYHNRFTKSFDQILQDDSVFIVIEAMGGLHPAYDYVKQALLKGKHVITSNKELVAQKGAELLALAKENGVVFYFEASVGGGIPVIRPMHLCLAANKILEITGILNGTTNFILTKMIQEQMGFDEALSLAQSLGYAEKDPSADVDGLDTCRKICILASLAFGRHVYPDEVQIQGIRGVSLADVEYAKTFGYAVKLIAKTKAAENKKCEIFVGPTLVPADNQLCSVDDVFNGVLIYADATGEVLFYGKGAGKLPTASAVVADVVHIIAAKDSPPLIYWEDAAHDSVLDSVLYKNKFYYRLHGVFAKEQIESAFGALLHYQSSGNETVFVSQPLLEQSLSQRERELCEEKNIAAKMRAL